MVRVLAISGPGRDAATLLERVLGELPGAYPLGEVVRLWQRDGHRTARCGCGRRLAGCAFWHRLGAAAFDGWDRVDYDRVIALRDLVERTRNVSRLATSRLTADRRALVVEYASFPARVYAAAQAVTACPVLIDSSRPGALAYCMHWATGVDIRLIRLVRKTRAAGPPSGVDQLLARCGVPVGYLDFDRFLAEPAGTARALAGFAGLTVTDSDLGYLGGDSVRLRRRHRIVADRALTDPAGEVPLRREGRQQPTWPHDPPPRAARTGAVPARAGGVPLLPASGHRAALERLP